MEGCFVSKVPQEVLNPAIDLCWFHTDLLFRFQSSNEKTRFHYFSLTNKEFIGRITILLPLIFNFKVSRSDSIAYAIKYFFCRFFRCIVNENPVST